MDFSETAHQRHRQRVGDGRGVLLARRTVLSLSGTAF
jgi:hypothetical protein